MKPVIDLRTIAVPREEAAVNPFSTRTFESLTAGERTQLLKMVAERLGLVTAPKGK